MPGEAQRVIEEFWRIQDGGDYTKLVDLFAEDAFLEDPIWGQYRGRDAILGFMTTMVKEMGTRKVHFTVDEICGDDHAVWARWTMHMDGHEPRGGVGIYKVEGGKITEEAMYFDLPHLMMQAGLNPFPPQTATHLVQPGPMTHDGLLYDAQPEAQGAATLASINAMISDLGTWGLELPLEEELARSWNDDMIWWGPAGIGATYTIERYAKQHSGPFRAAFTDRSKTNHICRLAEGNYGGFFGWPNFTAIHTGGFMGMPASDERGEMRVIDIYRREGEKLSENWIFIDLLHFWKGLGVDILSRTTQIPPKVLSDE